MGNRNPLLLLRGGLTLFFAHRIDIGWSDRVNSTYWSRRLGVRWNTRVTHDLPGLPAKGPHRYGNG